MGTTTAMGYGGAAASGLASRRAAMTAHVTTNFYPPLPAEYADVALTALAHLELAGMYLDEDDHSIEVEDEGVWATVIPLPLAIDPLPRLTVGLGNDRYGITVAEAVRILRLDGFIAAFAGGDE